jgi:polyhydroxyalkanoate synthesis regulator phasin
VEGGRKQWEEIQERISDTVKKVLEGMDLCTKKEITAMSGRLEYLERRVATLEKEKQAAD